MLSMSYVLCSVALGQNISAPPNKGQLPCSPTISLFHRLGRLDSFARPQLGSRPFPFCLVMSFSLRAHCSSVSSSSFLNPVMGVGFNRASTSGRVNSAMRLSCALTRCSEEQRREEKWNPIVSCANPPLGRFPRIYSFSRSP